MLFAGLNDNIFIRIYNHFNAYNNLFLIYMLTFEFRLSKNNIFQQNKRLPGNFFSSSVLFLMNSFL